MPSSDLGTTIIQSGKKWDGGKQPAFQGLVQYFPRAMLCVAGISKYGTEKYNLEYSDRNWSRVEHAKDRYRDALTRHLLLEQIEGATDKESSLLHAGHMAWCALAYLELLLQEGELK